MGSDARPGARRQGRRARWLLAASGTVAVVAAAAASLAHDALAVRDDLLRAQEHLTTASVAGLGGDTPAAGTALASAQAATARAEDRSSGLLWRLARSVPVAGDSVDAIRTLSAQADVITTDVAPALLAVARDLEPGRLRTSGDTVDVAALAGAGPTLERAAEDLHGVRASIAAARDGVLPHELDRPLQEARDEADRMARTLDHAARAVRLLPPMLGADGPRRYLLAFQNPAEARGTGGIMGAYGVLEADRGRLKVVELGTDADLPPAPPLPEPSVLGPDFEQLWGNDPALWVNANMSPHFPSAARIWLDAWEETRGDRLDGVLALDPVALSYLLGAGGDVVLADGEVVTADTVVPETLSAAYQRFEHDNDARKDYLVDVSAAVVAQLLRAEGDPGALVDALRRAAGERRLLVHSVVGEEQAQLERAGVAGALPRRSGPWAMVTVNSAKAAKLDYYLAREVRYSGRPCRVGDLLRETRLAVRLENTVADEVLPHYVTGPALPVPGRDATSRSVHRVVVGLHLSTGAAVQDLRLDGRRVPFQAGTDAGHPTVLVPVDLAPGEPRQLVLELREPSSGATPALEEQPLVRGQTSSLTVPTCGR